MKIRPVLTAVGIAVAAVLFFRVYVHAASTLQFSPSAKTVTPNTEFSVALSLQADQAVYAADAVVLYTTADLEVVSAANGNFFDTFGSATDVTNGRIELHGYFANSTADAKSGSGTFATVTFKAKRGSGTGTVSFACASSGNDTFLLTPEGTNILSCSSLNTLTVTYAGAQPSPTLSPTPEVGGPQPTSTPTPQPGVNSEPSCTGISFLPTFNATTFSTITIYCQGTDSDGNLNAAQYDFGDGNSRIVSGTASGGKISTTYKYAKTGTYGISCKVRDNSGAWSGTPEICKSKITVGQGVAGGGRSGRSTFIPTPTKKYAPGVATPTPTIPLITLTEYVSPTPFIGKEESTEEMPETAEENPLQRILLYAGGGIIVVAILLFLVKKLTGGPPSNPPVILPPIT